MTARLVTDPNLAPIAFDGADAASFLHNQLSSDVEGMPVGSASWTTYNSPKGRVLASPLLWRRGPQGFVAFVPGDLAEALRKRLSMFVLRAKVAVRDLAVDHAVLGVVGAGAQTAAERAGTPFVALPDGRCLVLALAADADNVRAKIAAETAEATDWEWLGIQAGVAQITRATQDLFVPQTANFDLVGGINFRKGCYPGQEIVARMQYLGRLKERLFAFHVDGPPPEPGTKVFGADPTQGVGTVVNAAPAPQGGSDLLAVVSWSAVDDGGELRVGAPDGALLTAQPLPYAVPTPTSPTRVKM